MENKSMEISASLGGKVSTQLSFEANREWLQHLVDSGQLGNVRNIEQAFTIAQYGRELGFSPMVAFNYIISIKGRLTLSVKAQKALLFRAGITWKTVADGLWLYADGQMSQFQVNLGANNAVINRISKIEFTRTMPNGVVMEETGLFAWSEGVAAGLVKDDSNWLKYPRQMLTARAFANGADKIAADILAGFATTEEMVEAYSVEESRIVRDDETGEITQVLDISEA